MCVLVNPNYMEFSGTDAIRLSSIHLVQIWTQPSKKHIIFAVLKAVSFAVFFCAIDTLPCAGLDICKSKILVCRIDNSLIAHEVSNCA